MNRAQETLFPSQIICNCLLPASTSPISYPRSGNGGFTAGLVEFALVIGNRREDDRHADQGWEHPEDGAHLASGEQRKQPRAAKYQESRVARNASAHH